MAAILGSRTFSSGADDFMSGIERFIEQHTGNGTVSIKVQIAKEGEMRQSIATASQLLLDLVEGHDSIWEQYGYKFLFRERLYMWHDEPIHITCGEALFLCRWLVLKQKPGEQMYFLHNLRKRYGASFLKEAEENSGDD
jgi:hypothetical protein